MKVYISGKIGEEVISDATRQKFVRAEKMLEAKGYDVFNPTDPEWQYIQSRCFNREKENAIIITVNDWYSYILLKDLRELALCDAIYMLADSEYSPGSNVEFDFAQATRKKLFWEAEIDSKIFCDESGNYIGEWLPIEEVSSV